MSSCEDNLCDNSQSAVCLHCMHRFCASHITSHLKVLLHQVELDELTGQVDQLEQHLENASKEILRARNTDQEKVDDWYAHRTTQLKKKYDQKIQPINDHHTTLTQFESQLNRRLAFEVQQPLSQIKAQHEISTESLESIRSTIESVTKDITQLKWDLAKARANTNNKSKGKHRAIKRSKPTSQHTSNFDISTIDNKDEIESMTSAMKELSGMRTRRWKPRNYLCRLFRDIGPGSSDRIDQYIQNEMKDEDSLERRGLITLVFSFVETWNKTKTKKGKYKELILKRHILTIKQYLTGMDRQRQFLVGLQYFFHTLKRSGSTEVELMTMLLNFFFTHRCFTESVLIDWYWNDNSMDSIIRKKVLKEWAEPFMNEKNFLAESPDSTSMVTSVSSEEPVVSSCLPTVTRVCPKKPFKRLVQLFQDISDESERKIHRYIKIQYKNGGSGCVMTVVRSYLKAWDDSLAEQKIKILMKHMLTVKYYQDERDFEMQIMFAFQIFFSERTENPNWSIRTMSALLEFFLEQHCITKETILKWKSDGHLSGYAYHQETLSLAQPFIQQLMVTT